MSVIVLCNLSVLFCLFFGVVVVSCDTQIQSRVPGLVTVSVEALWGELWIGTIFNLLQKSL